MFFLLLNNIYRYYGYNKATEGLREGGDEENGPKRRELRRLGHKYVFSFSYRFFFLLIHIYRYYGCYGATEGCAGFYEEKNGPKQRDMRCLGHMVSFFYLYSCFFIHTLIL